jgi:hypothetical protein
MAVPAFGWSIGDIINLIQILTAIGKAFKDAGGAVIKYK